MGFLEFFFYGMYLRILSRKTIYGYPFPRCITNTYYCTLIMINWFIRNNDFDGWKLGASTQTFTFASKMVLCASLCESERACAEDWGWTQNHRFYDPYVAIHLSFEAYFIAGYLHITLFSKESRGLWLTSTRYSKTLAATQGFVSLNSNFWISKALENQN